MRQQQISVVYELLTEEISRFNLGTFPQHTVAKSEFCLPEKIELEHLFLVQIVQKSYFKNQ